MTKKSISEPVPKKHNMVHVVAQVTKYGHSVVVCLPKPLKDVLGVDIGDKVIIIPYDLLTLTGLLYNENADTQ